LWGTADLTIVDNSCTGIGGVMFFHVFTNITVINTMVAIVGGPLAFA